MTNAVVHTLVKKVAAESITDASDTLAAEDPLEIRLVHGPSHNRRQQNISVTMRTPGEDMELAAGFLFTEGVISEYAAIQEIILSEDSNGSIATVHLKPGTEARLGNTRRNFAATAACGVCGKTDIADIHTGVTVNNSTFCLAAGKLFGLPAVLRNEQALFDSTGGLHAAGLFNGNMELLLLREDIGRHNAVDKLIGAALQQQPAPLEECVLLLSGRAGFELIQKAAMAGIPVIAAIGAPSSMAVKMAAEWNITLLGFLKDQRFNIYSGSERIDVR
ncbi:formate dehydrogenase accessory sulfurtransferase FdhD [Chitinophaga polysaccharea]|uniref:formate dehydrogenase accessory sulfurtransferase FdhD n=1 Tax=Chitinophaga polysaccharea TaxID=1293035 RepID=UPI001156F607|nr:formate dehydrogenase accessory sulfurtransferase FdhD [Chitinophaga polysaccharea]